MHELDTDSRECRALTAHHITANSLAPKRGLTQSIGTTWHRDVGHLSRRLMKLLYTFPQGQNDGRFAAVLIAETATFVNR